MKKYVMGLDFGTLSCRAVIVDAENGKILASAVSEYAHGVMDTQLPDGTPLLPHSALEHPEDYISSMRRVIAQSLGGAALSASDISGIGVDFTACTVLPVDKNARPMCTYDRYKSDENAYVKLWKSHSAEKEAKQIQRVAEARGEKFLDACGGEVSSEFMLPKLLQTLHNSPELFADTDKFVEAGDWIVRLLTGKYAPSPSCAGFKGFWSCEQGYPEGDFFLAVDGRFDGIVGTKLCAEVAPSGQILAGYVCREGAELFGLCEGTAVAVAVIDAHAGAPAVGAVGEGNLMMILGTSGCHIVSSEKRCKIKGAVYADGALFDGLCTYEQGQCCFGDAFDWYVSNFVPADYTLAAEKEGKSIHQYLRERAAALKIGESGLVVLDWFNGNRSVLADGQLSGMILGLTLATRPEHIYRALIEAQAFGTRLVLDNYEKNGIAVKTIRASGGIALKDSLLMQIFADVLGREIAVSSSTQACAVGSAIYGAVACGIYGDIISASEKMCAPIAKAYTPNAESTAAYMPLLEEYVTLHDYFGRGANDVMKRLLKK